tara:strand:+ start:2861 stop:3274 length:414 start_codon:yes stop_codon:yes gene_type:complete
MKEKESLNQLISDISDAVSGDSESAKTFLISKGVDTDDFLNKGMAAIKKAKFIRTAKLNEQKDTELEERAWQKILATAKDKVISELDAIKLLMPNLKGAPALYSKLEKLSEEDLKKALEEEGVLKLMEQLEKKKDDQ